MVVQASNSNSSSRSRSRSRSSSSSSNSSRRAQIEIMTSEADLTKAIKKREQAETAKGIQYWWLLWNKGALIDLVWAREARYIKFWKFKQRSRYTRKLYKTRYRFQVSRHLYMLHLKAEAAALEAEAAAAAEVVYLTAMAALRGR